MRNKRFEPYIKTEFIIIFERLKEVTGMSYGTLLEKILIESDTFIELHENYYCTDAELEEIFKGSFRAKSD